jgi:AP-2 complex subunit alpha
VQLGAYVLGEFGFLIAEEPLRSGDQQLHLLMQHWAAASVPTQAQMLSALAKMANLYEECRPLAAAVFAKHVASPQLDLQQRAVEYAALPGLGEEAVEDVLREMPVGVGPTTDAAGVT